MGGSGSGRFKYGLAKKHTRKCPARCTTPASRGKASTLDDSFSYSWICNGREAAAVDVTIKSARMVLSYGFRDPPGRREEYLLKKSAWNGVPATTEDAGLGFCAQSTRVGGGWLSFIFRPAPALISGSLVATAITWPMLAKGCRLIYERSGEHRRSGSGWEELRIWLIRTQEYRKGCIGVPTIGSAACMTKQTRIHGGPGWYIEWRNSRNAAGRKVLRRMFLSLFRPRRG